MSATGNPAQVIWVILKNPQDEVSIFTMLVDDSQVGVFLFTQREHAEEFARSCSDCPKAAFISPVEVSGLARVLSEQTQRGATHVVTDPILGAGRYLDQKTLKIPEYIAQLQR
jgi:hypothetical protein